MMSANEANENDGSGSPFSPENRAFTRTILAGLAMAGILARPLSDDDGYSLTHVQEIPERAIELADNLISKLSRR